MMTTKEIAKATGKPEQTVRNWIRYLASKSDLIASKLDASSPMKPADYNLAEVCMIIEEGMGKDVADVFRTNAVQSEMKVEKKRYSAAYIAEARKTMGIEYARRLMQENEGYIAIEAPEKLPDHIAKQVYAVAMSAIKKTIAESEQKRISGSLF